MRATASRIAAVPLAPQPDLDLDDVARRWEVLDPLDQRRYGGDPRAALYAYTCEYVETVEAGGPGSDEMDSRGYESAMEALWRRHIDALRAVDAD